ncbi:hypothetical protein SARC_06845 [Sphaeroforma arctica JP610]|uniref:Pentacotripeptide-repeat region of PRORP domain-containing protein n=1 Tax=Sphaeroforma arctica JP610 TaxID=667725 RepID=A0A0L0FXW7_9EUKA|nr:hypothetical protein SARC_06845 [Sphaeroforma arctica JP610]KNC80808.1 hypothetical protein SARC_06845 [Sphaeroforma arctica JP610]|eukprot:XP_014154710.1 hypothetical protein SARC_06845 [Sphaeroforma arctica JP610]
MYAQLHSNVSLHRQPRYTPNSNGYKNICSPRNSQVHTGCNRKIEPCKNDLSSRLSIYSDINSVNRRAEGGTRLTASRSAPSIRMYMTACTPLKIPNSRPSCRYSNKETQSLNITHTHIRQLGSNKSGSFLSPSNADRYAISASLTQRTRGVDIAHSEKSCIKDTTFRYMRSHGPSISVPRSMRYSPAASATEEMNLASMRGRPTFSHIHAGRPIRTCSILKTQQTRSYSTGESSTDSPAQALVDGSTEKSTHPASDTISNEKFASEMKPDPPREKKSPQFYKSLSRQLKQRRELKYQEHRLGQARAWEKPMTGDEFIAGFVRILSDNGVPKPSSRINPNSTLRALKAIHNICDLPSAGRIKLMLESMESLAQSGASFNTRHFNCFLNLMSKYPAEAVALGVDTRMIVPYMDSKNVATDLVAYKCLVSIELAVNGWADAYGLLHYAKREYRNNRHKVPGLMYCMQPIIHAHLRETQNVANVVRAVSAFPDCTVVSKREQALKIHNRVWEMILISAGELQGPVGVLDVVKHMGYYGQEPRKENLACVVELAVKGEGSTRKLSEILPSLEEDVKQLKAQVYATQQRGIQEIKKEYSAAEVSARTSHAARPKPIAQRKSENLDNGSQLPALELARLSDYKIPSRIDTVDKFPKELRLEVYNKILLSVAGTNNLTLTKKVIRLMTNPDNPTPPSRYTYELLMKQYGHQDAEAAFKWFLEMKSAGIQPTTTTYELLMTIYNRFGQLDKTHKIYRLLQNDEGCYKREGAGLEVLSLGYARAGRLQEVHALTGRPSNYGQIIRGQPINENLENWSSNSSGQSQGKQPLARRTRKRKQSTPTGTEAATEMTEPVGSQEVGGGLMVEADRGVENTDTYSKIRATLGMSIPNGSSETNLPGYKSTGVGANKNIDTTDTVLLENINRKRIKLNRRIAKNVILWTEANNGNHRYTAKMLNEMHKGSAQQSLLQRDSWTGVSWNEMWTAHLLATSRGTRNLQLVEKVLKNMCRVDESLVRYNALHCALSCLGETQYKNGGVRVNVDANADPNMEVDVAVRIVRRVASAISTSLQTVPIAAPYAQTPRKVDNSPDKEKGRRNGSKSGSRTVRNSTSTRRAKVAQKRLANEHEMNVVSVEAVDNPNHGDVADLDGCSPLRVMKVVLSRGYELLFTLLSQNRRHYDVDTVLRAMRYDRLKPSPTIMSHIVKLTAGRHLETERILRAQRRKMRISGKAAAYAPVLLAAIEATSSSNTEKTSVELMKEAISELHVKTAFKAYKLVLHQSGRMGILNEPELLQDFITLAKKRRLEQETEVAEGMILPGGSMTRNGEGASLSEMSVALNHRQFYRARDKQMGPGQIDAITLQYYVHSLMSGFCANLDSSAEAVRNQHAHSQNPAASYVPTPTSCYVRPQNDYKPLPSWVDKGRMCDIQAPPTKPATGESSALSDAECIVYATLSVCHGVMQATGLADGIEARKLSAHAPLDEGSIYKRRLSALHEPRTETDDICDMYEHAGHVLRQLAMQWIGQGTDESLRRVFDVMDVIDAQCYNTVQVHSGDLGAGQKLHIADLLVADTLHEARTRYYRAIASEFVSKLPTEKALKLLLERVFNCANNEYAGKRSLKAVQELSYVLGWQYNIQGKGAMRRVLGEINANYTKQRGDLDQLAQY